ncbi:FAD-dependent oxidoreductase [Chloroflexota bacterium]
MKVSEQVLTTDVLVIGAGLAGCFAAIRAKELGADVVMVEQGKSGFSGMSAHGMQMLRVVLPEDDFDVAMAGTVLECEYMIDQEFLEVGMKETWDRFQDLLKFGINFRRDDSGQILWYFTDTIYPPFKQRFAVWEPAGTYVQMQKMKKEAIRRGVKILDRIFVVDLIVSSGKVSGAIGFHTIEGNLYLVKAKAVVIATGSCIGPGHTYPQLTGDGMAIALRAGAELRNMEFGTGMTGWIAGGGPPFVFYFRNPQPEYPVTNARGEEFLEKYEMTRRLPGRKYDGPPWRTQAHAVLREYKEGRGPCYVDYRVPNLNSILREFYGSMFDQTLKQIEGTGITLDKVKYELGVGIIIGQGWGIRINASCETTLPGLCAAGVASDLCGSTEFSILCGHAGSIVTGHRAGESAAKYTLTQPKLESIDEGQLSKLRREIFAPLDRKYGITPDKIRMNIVETWLNIDVREETRLKKAQEQLQKIEKDVSNLSVDDYHELVKCHKVRNLLEYSQAVAGAAMMRRETRLGHIRWDYPLRDNKDWLKWVINRRVGDELHTVVENIPIEQWKYKPEPTLVDPLEPTRKEASS